MVGVRKYWSTKNSACKLKRIFTPLEYIHGERDMKRKRKGKKSNKSS